MINVEEIETNWGKISGLKNKMNEVEKRRAEYLILPEEKENSGVLLALKLTPLKSVKVLIFGQDPYPNTNNAHGLAFSNKNGKIPASLKNIFLEIKRDIGIENKNGNLENWAKQGVLLLNTALTYSEQNKSTKKRFLFWEEVVDDIIDKVISRQKPLVIMLWGNFANMLKQFPLEEDENYLKKNILILRSSHPSNMGNANKTPIMDGKVSAFTSCSHFSKCNNFLEKNNLIPIDWKTECEQKQISLL